MLEDNTHSRSALNRAHRSTDPGEVGSCHPCLSSAALGPGVVPFPAQGLVWRGSGLRLIGPGDLSVLPRGVGRSGDLPRLDLAGVRAGAGLVINITPHIYVAVLVSCSFSALFYLILQQPYDADTNISDVQGRGHGLESLSQEIGFKPKTPTTYTYPVSSEQVFQIPPPPKSLPGLPKAS